MNSKNYRNPVLLIHGILRKADIFDKMSAYLAERGWSVFAPNFHPNLGEMGLDQLAQQVVDYVNKNFAPEQPLDIVGLSMGGLVSRYYIQRLGGIDRVQRLITISSPHNGTVTAYLLNGQGCIQMRPDSIFLNDLNRDMAMLEQLNFTSIWTPWDFIIVPASSSQIPVGKEVQVQVFAHAMMVIDSQSLQAVAEALCTPLKPNRRLEHIRDRQKLPLGDSKT
jgi:triacylglycerol lipase